MKPLYFLTHEDNPWMFSGYGIPISEGKSPLAGMLMIDRPTRCPEGYLQELKKAFGEVVAGPMTLNGDRGLFTQMRVDDPYSLDLVKDDLSGLNMEETRYVLDLALKGGFLPKIRLKLHCSREYQEMLISIPFSLSTPSLILRSL
jgi:hypothetical protein